MISIDYDDGVVQGKITVAIPVTEAILFMFLLFLMNLLAVTLGVVLARMVVTT